MQLARGIDIKNLIVMNFETCGQSEKIRAQFVNNSLSLVFLSLPNR